MKKLSLLILFAVFTVFGAKGQNLLKTDWSTGDMHLYCHEVNGSTYTFSVGFIHDAGGDLILKKVSENVFEAVNPENFKYGATYVKATLKTINCPKTGSTKYFRFEDAKGNLLGIFPQYNDNYSDMTTMTDVLEGTYKGNDGKTYIFNGKTLTINGQSSEIEPLQCEFGYVNGFKYKGTKYCFKISEKGINLYTTNTDDSEFEYEPDKLWVKLTLEDKTNDGRWTITKNKIVLEAYVGYYTKSLARIMRNEIYARHGYNFNSADLKTYFGSKPWYKPVANNSQVKLSELEQLNIEILKHCENNFTWTDNNVDK